VIELRRKRMGLRTMDTQPEVRPASQELEGSEYPKVFLGLSDATGTTAERIRSDDPTAQRRKSTRIKTGHKKYAQKNLTSASPQKKATRRSIGGLHFQRTQIKKASNE